MLEAVKRRDHREPLAHLCDKWLGSTYSIMLLEESPTGYLDRSKFRHVGETNFWVDRGVMPWRIHAVNRNSAVIAQVRRQRRLRRVHTHGGSIDKIEGVQVDLLNLDFCANISEEVLRVVRDTAHRVLAHRGVIAVAVMKGREQFWSRRGVPATVSRRERLILQTIEEAGFKILEYKSHQYRSGIVPMFWLAAKVRRVK